MKEILAAGGVLAIALWMFILSIRSFQQKGFLLNNAYLYASKKEREAMDKAPYYRQTAIVFILIGIIFLLNGFGALFPAAWIFPVVLAGIAVTLVYAIASSVAIERKKKQP